VPVFVPVELVLRMRVIVSAGMFVLVGVLAGRVLVLVLMAVCMAVLVRVRRPVGVRVLMRMGVFVRVLVVVLVLVFSFHGFTSRSQAPDSRIDLLPL